MRRKPPFPTKAEWLARRGRADEQPENPKEQPECHEEQREPDEPGADRPVISFAPRRPYWR